MKSSEKGFHLFNSIIVVIPETIDCIAYNLKVEYLLIVIVFEIFILILNALLNLTWRFISLYKYQHCVFCLVNYIIITKF